MKNINLPTRRNMVSILGEDFFKEVNQLENKINTDFFNFKMFLHCIPSRYT